MNLSNNGIRKIPQGLVRLEKLENLISNNDVIRKIPQGLVRLEKLEILISNNNPITTPQKIGELDNLQGSASALELPEIAVEDGQQEIPHRTIEQSSLSNFARRFCNCIFSRP